MWDPLQHETIISPHGGILLIWECDKMRLHPVLNLPQSPGKPWPTCTVWNEATTIPGTAPHGDSSRGSNRHRGAQHSRNQEFQAAAQVCKAECTAQVQSITVLCLVSHSYGHVNWCEWCMGLHFSTSLHPKQWKLKQNHSNNFDCPSSARREWKYPQTKATLVPLCVWTETEAVCAVLLIPVYCVCV